MASELIIYVDSDNNIMEEGVRNALTNDYINDATVTFTLREYDPSVLNTAAEGSEAVVGSMSNQAMSYQNGSYGRYVGVLPDTVDLVPNAQYWIDISIVATGLNKRVRKLVRARFAGTE